MKSIYSAQYHNDFWVAKLIRRNIPRPVAVSVARTLARRIEEIPPHERPAYLRTIGTPAQLLGRTDKNPPPELTTLQVPQPPKRFFYNRFWMAKLRSWGLPYVAAGLLAEHIARQCYLAPPDIRASILREWNDPARHQDMAALMCEIRRIWEGKRKTV